MSKSQPIEMQDDIEVGTQVGVAVAPPPDNLRVNRIERSSGWVGINFRELWDSRELIYFLIWRDVKVRYKQSLLGAAWAILQPFLTMVIFTIFFGRLAKIPSDGVPYPLFSYSALVAWTFFATGLGRGADGLVGSAEMIKKVYFPRMAVPVARVAAPLVDFFLSFLVLILMMRRYHVAPSVRLLWLPACVLLVVITALGASLWLSALNVEFRDVQFVVPFLIQIWFFATPVIYPASMVPQRWRVLYAMNPMASAIETFRWALLGSPRGSGFALAMSVFIALAVLISGAVFFRRMEKSFADIL